MNIVRFFGLTLLGVACYIYAIIDMKNASEDEAGQLTKFQPEVDRGHDFSEVSSLRNRKTHLAGTKLQSRNEPLQIQSRNEPLQIQSRNEPIQIQSRNEPLQIQSRNEPLQIQSRNEPLQQRIQTPRTLTCIIKISLFDKWPGVVCECSSTVGFRIISLDYEKIINLLNIYGVENSKCQLMIYGKMKCYEICGLVQLVLMSSNSFEDSKISDHPETKSLNFHIESIKTGRYKLLLQNKDQCWLETFFQVNTGNDESTQRVRLGYSGCLDTCNLSRDSLHNVINVSPFQNSEEPPLNFNSHHERTRVQENIHAVMNASQLDAGEGLVFNKPDDEVKLIPMEGTKITPFNPWPQKSPMESDVKKDPKVFELGGWCLLSVIT